MGGGDLNLKKSWHPQTLRNVEKVWKAEQKAEAEAKKIEQLRRELEEERAREEMQRHAIEQGVVKKKSEKLEWMYSAPGQINHEEYLLGKTIDKAVDPLAQDTQPEDNTPAATLLGDSGANSANDLAAKVRDDPLFMIMKKEEDKKKELMNNPVKMKQLRQMLQENLAKNKKKKDKKKKKEKKKKKRKKEKYRNESDTSSEDETHSRDRKVVENGSHHTSSDRISHHRRSDHYGLHDKHNHHLSRTERHRSHSTSPVVSHHKDHRSRDRWKDTNDMQVKRHKHSSYSPTQRRNRSRSPYYRRNRSRSPLHSRRRSRSRSPYRQPKTQENSTSRDKWQRGSNISRRMDQAELEKRRAEMMNNAKERDVQQRINIKRHREEKKREENEEANLRGKDSAKFLDAMKVQSYSSKATASVGDRIKRNINSIQRTPAALESFLK